MPPDQRGWCFRHPQDPLAFTKPIAVNKTVTVSPAVTIVPGNLEAEFGGEVAKSLAKGDYYVVATGEREATAQWSCGRPRPSIWSASTVSC